MPAPNDKDAGERPANVEIRSLMGVELRDDGDDGPLIVGYAAPFDKLSVDLGGFRERSEQGAFAATISDGHDIRSLVNHDKNQRLARSQNGTLTLKEDDTGLKVEIKPPDTQVGRDTVEDIRNGNLDGMSFVFLTITDRWEVKDGVEIRTLEEVELLEAGPVTFPAYPDTTVAVRSLERHRAAQTDDGDEGQPQITQITQTKDMRVTTNDGTEMLAAGLAPASDTDADRLRRRLERAKARYQAWRRGEGPADGGASTR